MSDIGFDVKVITNYLRVIVRVLQSRLYTGKSQELPVYTFIKIVLRRNYVK